MPPIGIPRLAFWCPIVMFRYPVFCWDPGWGAFRTPTKEIGR